LLERGSFDLLLPEFDKPWVIHLRETCCCSTNLCTWRPNTIYKNRHVRRHQLLYIAATNQVVSSALVVDHTEDSKEHGVHRPVYYLSEVLSPTKQRYPHYQKLAYATYMTGKKLPHYFECHSIIVVASTPVSSILNNPDATGRVSLWGITLGPWEIMYQWQSAIKSQVLPDFIAEWTKA
jgi:hypothetical protein